MLSTTEPTKPTSSVTSTLPAAQMIAVSLDRRLTSGGATEENSLDSFESDVTLTANSQALRAATEKPARAWSQLQAWTLEKTACEESKAMMAQGKEERPLLLQEPKSAVAKELDKMTSGTWQQFDEKASEELSLKTQEIQQQLTTMVMTMVDSMSRLEARVEQLERKVRAISVEMDDMKAAVDGSEQGVHRLRSHTFRKNRDIVDLEISEEGDLVPLVRPA